jgi:4-amino-4-deoxy-L-arabinose transferase-like glycosyltransferase
MRSFLKVLLVFLATFAVLILLHWPLLRLPYFWDEAGYYIPAALDFSRAWLLIPKSTLPEGHPPLVMIYLGLAWRVCGYSAWITRAAMTLIATATLAALDALARRVASREIAIWSVLLLALSPLFFAQSTLAHLDLAAALFTVLAVLFLLGDQAWLFVLAASLAVLSKETAVVLLPVVWLEVWRRRRGLPRAPLSTWIPLVAPLLPLAAWTLYYHHSTGYWIGNRGYLSYNVYSTLAPARVFWSLLRRVHQLFISGFNWLLTSGALAGLWWGRKHAGDGTRDPGLGARDTENPARDSGHPTRETGYGIRDSVVTQDSSPESLALSPVRPWRPFIFLTGGLAAIYLLMLSVVGGAILPRYLLPVLPLFYLATVAMVTRLPRFPARLLLGAAAACFVGAWFINPPYPFPLEDNLAYADFIRLHQQAAHYLETQPGRPRILTAWPATGELASPFLGYVRDPLRVVPVEGFAPQDLGSVPPDSFDLLYLYSRRWEPPGNWVARSPAWLQMQVRYFDYHPQADAPAVAARFHLHLITEMERRGQWVRIYAH